jgi:hypothetical protein
METVDNLPGVAIPDIWGNKNSDKPQTCHIEAAGQEPVSGQTVDVKAGEHYDKGNGDSESRTLHLFLGQIPGCKEPSACIRFSKDDFPFTTKISKIAAANEIFRVYKH